MRFFRASGLAVAALVGCTFGGLADYDAPECDPSAARTKDPCESLNVGPARCPRYHCSSVTRHCVAEIAAEVCDGVDNDCNGATDEDLLLPSASSASSASTDAQLGIGATDLMMGPGATSSEIYGAFVAAKCAHAFVFAGAAPVAVELGCDADSSLRQPFVGPIFTAPSPVLGVAAVATHGRSDAGACASGIVTFAVSAGKRLDVSGCGASLPSFASFRGGDQAVVAYYDVGVDRPRDATRDCASVTPASLRMRWVQQASGISPVPATFGTATTNSMSMRAAALLAIAPGDFLLLAAPADGGVRAWALGKDVKGAAAVVPLFADPLPGMSGARGVSMAAGGPPSSPRVAIVAELGCGPERALAMFLADVDGRNTRATALGTFEVTAAGTPASHPSVTWVDSRAEWWVSWTVDAPEGSTVRVRRFGFDGRPAGGASDLGRGLLAIVRGNERAGFGSNVFVASEAAVTESSVRCP